MIVREAEPRDADRVLELMVGLTRPAVAENPAPQREVFLAHLAHDDCRIYVAELDGEIAGAISLWIQLRLNWTTPQGWIPDLYVHEDFRRRGAARGLLDACAEECRRRGCHVLTLESAHYRADAHQLYESYGFVHHARAYILTLSD